MHEKSFFRTLLEGHLEESVSASLSLGTLPVRCDIKRRDVTFENKEENMAEDPIKVDPNHYKVEFENEQVRVLRGSATVPAKNL